MVGDILDSFKDEIKKRTSNPFLGTFTIIWCLRNWEVIYSFFHFDTDKNFNENLLCQIDFLKAHFYHESFFENLVWCVVFTFLSLIVSYFFINLSRLIVNFYDKIITPLVYKWTDKGSIVLKKDLETMQKERNELREKLQEEKDKRFKAEAEKEENENRFREANLKVFDLNQELSELKATKQNPIKNIVINDSEIKTKTNSKSNSKQKSISIIKKTEAEKIYKVIKSKQNYDECFKNLIGAAITKEAYSKLNIGEDEIFISGLGLFETKSPSGASFVYFELTPLGEKVKKLYYLEQQDKIEEEKEG